VTVNIFTLLELQTLMERKKLQLHWKKHIPAVDMVLQLPELFLMYRNQGFRYCEPDHATVKQMCQIKVFLDAYCSTIAMVWLITFRLKGN